MKPLRLEITGFGPYLDTQVVDFERLGEHGLFLIHGRTGSGKSSILDALCYALYGETTGGERDGQDMITTHRLGASDAEPPSVETKVLLDFEHLGARYRVVRQPTQEVARASGVGTRTRAADATLENLSAGEVVASKVRDVTTAVKDMLRCDVDQFRQTVVLPQGDFRRVVTDDSARRAILTRIFRTETFERLAERLKEYAKGLSGQGKAIRAEREALLAELGVANSAEIDALVNAAGATAKAAAEQRKAAVAAKDAAMLAKVAGDGIEADFELLERLEKQAVDLKARADEMTSVGEVVARATKAAALSDSRNHLDTRSREHERLRESLGESEKVAEHARAAVAESSAALAALETAERVALTTAEARLHQLNGQKDRVVGLTGLQGSLEAIRRDLDAAQKRVADLQGALGTASTRIDELDGEATRAATAAADLDAARDALDAAIKDLEVWDTLETLRAERESLDAAIERAHAEDALHHLQAAVSHSAPGLLAGGLVDGEPCPVCGSAHHPAPSSSQDLSALTAAFEAFGAAAAEREGLAVRRDVVISRMTPDQEARGWTEERPPRDELERIVAAAKERTATAETAKTRLVALAGDLATARTSHATTQADLGAAVATAADLTTTVSSLETRISATLDALPEEYRDPAAFEANLASIGALVADLKRRFADAEGAVTDAGKHEATAVATLKSLQGQFTTAAEALQSAGDEFARKLAESGFADRADFEAAELDPDELEERRTELETYRAEVTNTDVEIGALKRKLDGMTRPDLTALTAALEETQRLLKAAEDAWVAAARHHDDVTRGHARFVDLEKRDAELAARRDAAIKLDQLANGQLPGRVKLKLETFVLQSIFHEVLEEGNRHLRHMTGGRYTLLLRETAGASDSGLELDVRDNAAGAATRPVATLSGGEGFLASLALALGLSEVAQRRSGGTELGALFIDEGFGSLDADALDHVVGILKGLQDGHRMVGVISHVEELKRRIPARLHVVTGQAGSRVEMRLND